MADSRACCENGGYLSEFRVSSLGKQGEFSFHASLFPPPLLPLLVLAPLFHPFLPLEKLFWRMDLSTKFNLRENRSEGEFQQRTTSLNITDFFQVLLLSQGEKAPRIQKKSTPFSLTGSRIGHCVVWSVWANVDVGGKRWNRLDLEATKKHLSNLHFSIRSFRAT